MIATYDDAVRAGCIVAFQDGEHRILRDGCIVVADDRITFVGEGYAEPFDREGRPARPDHHAGPDQHPRAPRRVAHRQVPCRRTSATGSSGSPA